MPPWVQALIIIGAVGVSIACQFYSLWSEEPHETTRCNTENCGYHNERPSENIDRRERYDTPPDLRLRQRHDDCPICLDPICFKPQHTLPCQHRLHSECYISLRTQSNTCPICRRPL